MDFEFDAAKDRKNRANHGVSLAVDRLVIENEIACIPDQRMDYGEERWISFGFVGERLFVRVYAMRGETCRLISVRPATKAEHEAIGEG